jgi:class 3 adenylate cyclase/tetratricopeptide (TPR) repeat protein
VTAIADWLKTVGLEKYAPVLAEHEITLEVLPHLTQSDIDQLGLPTGPRRRLMVEVQALAAPPTTPPPAGLTQGAERRQLTVMFCDLVGSTALAERLDPEELRDLMQTYRKACGDVAARYEGHVAQYLGDGLMIYFGWPRAHEDDAERGVRAALEMVQAVHRLSTTETLAVRIGLATGPVVVGDAAKESHTEATLAVGETPNLAARLQGLAGTNQVVIASATRRLVGDMFVLTDLGIHVVKGLADPVPAWRVDALRRSAGRFEATHGGSALTPLVGREEENTLLQRRWQQAVGGSGQVVLVSGEAGIGKSRLARVLREHITEPHSVFRYQCSPFHVHSALYPFLEQFEFQAGFSRDDAPDERLNKLEASLVGTEAQRAEAAPLLAAALSLPNDRYAAIKVTPQRQKEQTLEAIAGQIGARARTGAVLMLFEDLHWVDPTSQELLDLLVPRLQDLPVLLIGTYRPEHSPPWAGQPNVTTLTLSRLGRPQVAQLVDRVTGGRPMPSEVLAEILARTDGVPLFVEELTKSVLESGLLRLEAGDRYALQAPLGTLAIPTSLRDSLAARLDRLTSVKEIAQIGACIGREFSYELLSRISTLDGDALEAALDRLVDAGLVIRRGSPPAANYTFKHALVQDVAYDSLLKSRRSQLHARIAHVLSAELTDRAALEPSLLAHHHTHAGNLAEAIPLWRKAGERAVERVAMLEAVAHFQKGLGLIDQLPHAADRDALELTIREQLNAAWAGLRGWAAAEIDANSAAILRLARSQNNPRSLLLGIWWMWTSTITQGRIADSLPWAKQLLAEADVAEDADDLDLRIFGHATAAIPYFFLGQLVDAQTHAERVRALYDPQRAERWIQLTGHDLRTFVDVYGCQWTWMLGYPDQAIAMAQRANSQADIVGHAFNLVWARTFTAYTFAYRREPGPLLERLEEVDRLAREQGLAFLYEVSAPQAEGLARLQQGRLPEAIPIIRKGIQSWTSLGGHVRTPFLKAGLAEALALQGDLDVALNLIDECVEQIERPGWQERVWLPEVLRLKGWMLMQQDRPAEAETQLRLSLSCAAGQQAKSWELRTATTLADLLGRQGKHREAHALLAPIYAWFTEGFETPDLVEARTMLSTLAGS